MEKIIKITILSFFVFIIGIFFVGLNKNSIYDTKDLVGTKLNSFELKNLKDDYVISSDELKKNNFTLINFWASWCAPCRNEHPFLLKLNKENNLKLLGVNYKDKKNNALRFLKDLGNPYDYTTKDKLGKDSVFFGIYGIPESILINSDLVVLKKFIGPITKKDFELIKKTISGL